MSNEVYEVIVTDGAIPVRVSAKSKAAAKKFALANVQVRRMSGAEVIAAKEQGLAIAQAEDSAE